jgi:hypothetical protein
MLRFPSSRYEGYILIDSSDIYKYEADYTLVNPVCQYCDDDISDDEYYLMFEGDPVCQDCEDKAGSGELEW